MRLSGLSYGKWLIAGVAIMLIWFVASSLETEKHVLDEDFSGIRVAIPRAAVTLDGKFATDAASARVLRMISGGIVRINDEFEAVPAAAKRVENQGYKRFVVELRDVDFHDGVPLTAAWVKDFYDEMMRPEVGSSQKGLLEDIENIEVLSERRLAFNLKKPTPFFWSALEIPLTKQCVNDEFAVCGVGAYTISEIDGKNVFIINSLGDATSLRFEVIKDPMVQVLKLLRGNVDVVQGETPAELVKHVKNKGFKVVSKPSASYTYIGFNLSEGTITHEAKVRQAISLAIDRNAIINSVLDGEGTFADSLLMSGNPAYYGAQNFAYAPEEARAILMAAGYENGIDLNLSITTNPFVMRVAQIMREQMAEAGIRLHIQSSEWGSFYGNVKKGNFEAYILTWVGRFQPDIFRSVFHSEQVPPKGANRGRYKNAEMDALIEIATTEVDEFTRNNAARNVQILQEREMIYAPLWRKNHVILMGKNVKDCDVVADGGYEGLRECKLK